MQCARNVPQRTVCKQNATICILYATLRALRKAGNQPLFIAVAVTLVPPDVHHHWDVNLAMQRRRWRRKAINATTTTHWRRHQSMSIDASSSSCIKIRDQHSSDYILISSNFDIFVESRPNHVSVQTASMVTHSLAQPIIPAQSLPPSLLFITFVGSRHYNIRTNTILLLIITYLLGP